MSPKLSFNPVLVISLMKFAELAALYEQLHIPDFFRVIKYFYSIIELETAVIFKIN